MTEPSSSSSSVVTRLKQILEAEGRRQSWLARQVGVSEAQMSYFTQGLRIGDDKRELIALALQRSEGDLFDSDGNHLPPEHAPDGIAA